MCFSPVVSFTTSAILVVTGALALKKVTSPREWAFAAVPWVFALQQFIEGWLWLALPAPNIGGLSYWLTLAYGIFVGMVWPLWAPVSLFLLEPQRQRRHWMLIIVAAGGAIALFSLQRMLQFPVTAQIIDNTIVYGYPTEQPHSLLALYVIATCGAFFLSSYRLIVRLGAINLSAFLLTYYFYRYDLSSIWCLFAAIISGIIYLHFVQRRRYSAVFQVMA